MCRIRILSIGILCLLLLGCASMKEKKASWFSTTEGPKKAPSTFEATPPPPDPIDGPPLASRAAGPANGVLAGRVIDTFNQQRPGTLIQVNAIDENGKQEALEVSANAEGYFLVQGLEPGKKYRLAARAKKGEAVMGGTTIATPPNVVLVIKVSEDLPAPEPTAKGSGNGKKNKDAPPPAAKVKPGREQSWSPESSPKYLHEPDRGAESARSEGELPGRLTAPAAPARTPTAREALPPVRPEYQTLGPGLAANNPPRAVLPPAESVRPSAPSYPTAASSGVPSCTLSGNRLIDFTLNDLNGQPFRFSEQRGKLVLIDIWGTWCTACMQSLPYLVDLQRRYGGQGLEVLGIAYEEGMSPERVDRVKFVRTRQSLNYKILIGEGDDCPVLTKLNINSFPTLLLVDERGEIVWRSEGLNPKAKAQLEAELRKRLLND